MVDKLYLIKDVSRLSGLSIYTLKYYLNEGLICESGRSQETNYRYFDDKTIRRLEEIKKLRKEHVSLRKIKNILGVKPN